MDVLDRPQLSPDTQATLLLCGRFDVRSEARDELARPLSSAEYLRLAKFLMMHDRRPADLMSGNVGKLSSTGFSEDRLRALLGRGMAMALALERWSRSGVRVLGRGDPDYPVNLRKHLRSAAPHLFFVCGPSELLDAEALCVVGSRDATADGLEVARNLGWACAAANVVVVSGGARGVDREAMEAALEKGGMSVGILSDSLARAALSKDYRRAITDGRLVLASAVDPDSRFTVSNAMGRNKYLYALAKAAVIIDSDVKGGTWSGAVENAEHRWIPAYVRLNGETRPGNRRLADLGMVPLPENADNATDWIRCLLDKPPPKADAFNGSAQADLSLTNAAKEGLGHANEVSEYPLSNSAENLFNAFVTRVLMALRNEPRSEDEIADHFDIEPVQARRWLDKAVKRQIIWREGLAKAAVYKAPTRSPG